MLKGHDELFKTFLGDVAIARDFFSVHLPENIQPYCDLSTLRIQPTEFIDKALHKHYADILYSVTIKDKPGYLYLLVEHESTPDPLTTWEMLRSWVAIIERDIAQQKKENKGKKHKDDIVLPLVVPLLFYRGQQSPYPYSRSVFDCFTYPELAKDLWTHPYPLVDLSVIPDDQLRTHKSVALLELIQKHIRTRDMLELVNDIILFLQHYCRSHHLADSLMTYVANKGECSDFEQFFQVIAEQNQPYREEIMTIAEQLRQKGRQEGLQKGRQEGLEEGRQEGLDEGRKTVARAMLRENIPMDSIMRCTGLLEAEIEQLRTKH